MKIRRLAGALLAAGLFVAGPAIADTVAYPSSDDASFVLDYPSDWELVPGESEGDYMTLNAPTGAVLQLRAVEGSADAVDELVQENIAFLQETFSNVKLGEPQQLKQGEMEGSMLTGSGKDEEDQDVGFAMYFIALPDGSVADIWYSVVKGDEEGHNAAVEILNSFRTP